MCGINGIAFPLNSGRDVRRETLEGMRDLITHRGPDDCGVFLDRNIGLGHRRLSIVDVAHGAQPMTNEDGTLQIIFNGEIYNHAAIRPELEARGHVYQTHCDTETILHLYEETGAQCVERLRGMFAFAVWDASKQELFIARDRLGVKPLYYSHTADGALYFASEIKAVLHAGIKAELNHAVLPDYLANHATSDETTLFHNIKRLLPGHTLRWRAADGSIEIKKYWDISFNPQNFSADTPEPHATLERASRSLTEGTDQSFIGAWRELFEESVRLRLMADVPLGMFLSGGIDSSAIAAVMSRLVKDPIKTFSVAFAEREANELHYARIVSQAFGTEQHEITVTPQDFWAALPRLVWHEDEPLAHPSSVALYFVSKLAGEHVKVVLTGEGSDEMLAGYERYRKTIFNLAFGRRYHNMTSEPLRKSIVKLARLLLAPAGSYGHKWKAKIARTFLELAPEIDAIYFDNFAVFNRASQSELLSDEAKEQIASGGNNGDAEDALDPYRGVRARLAESDAATLLNRLLYADTKTYLHELLMKQDQMSMAASIESRVPFLDHKLVEFTAALPERMKLRGWQTKYILRQAMKDVLPAEILSRGKMGFPVPVGKWLRGEYKGVVDEYVLGERARARGLFDEGFVRRMVAEHVAGAANHSERLWSLINFEMWQRQFIDGEALHAQTTQRDDRSLVAV